jgi:hypothetical protein
VLRLILTLILLTTPATASGDVPVGWQREALKTAQTVWRPACGTLRISWENPATARVSTGSTEAWGGWAYLGECTIHEPLGRDWMGYPDFCTAVLHEGGHAAGHGHSRRGVMVAQRLTGLSIGRVNGHRRVSWSGVDRRCVRPQDRAERTVFG